MAILSDVQAELEALRQENAKLKAKAMSRQTITFKVSAEKGCLSVYGLGRFGARWPVAALGQGHP